VGPECQSLGPMVPRPRRPPSDNSGHHLACIHGFATTFSPPTVSPLPCHCRLPPLAAILSAHPHRGAPFLPPPPFTNHYAFIPATDEPPWIACSSLSPTDSTTPEHRAAVYNLPALRAVDHHPRCRPTAVPLRPTTPRHRAHSSGELLPSRRPKTGPPP
jgi:hypothetical protein